MFFVRGRVLVMLCLFGSFVRLHFKINVLFACFVRSFELVVLFDGLIWLFCSVVLLCCFVRWFELVVLFDGFVSWRLL